MTELLVIIAAFIYIATWAGAYKRGYDNGVRDARENFDFAIEMAKNNPPTITPFDPPPEQSPR